VLFVAVNNRTVMLLLNASAEEIKTMEIHDKRHQQVDTNVFLSHRNDRLPRWCSLAPQEVKVDRATQAAIALSARTAAERDNEYSFEVSSHRNA
jgi:hypothetical protein